MKYLTSYKPSFRGLHNATRCKVWLVLYNRYLDGKRGLTLRELSEKSGVGYKCLSVCLVKWVRWHYVGYQSRPGGRRYCILKRGREWIERWKDIMPLERYLEELHGLKRKKDE
jgi:hypothetical protein